MYVYNIVLILHYSTRIMHLCHSPITRNLKFTLSFMLSRNYKFKTGRENLGLNIRRDINLNKIMHHLTN